MRYSNLLASAIIPALLMLSACGGPECAKGSTLVDGVCIPNIGSCGQGTTSQNGSCVPICEDGYWWDGDACTQVVDCGPGTVLDESMGLCVLQVDDNCADGTSWDGERCIPDMNCGPGTSAENGGRCVPDLSCGPGTVLENGQCIPEGLPPGMIGEGDGPEPLLISLPEPGEKLTISGHVDEPRDLNNDGIVNPDWDGYSFDAPAGAWLRISLASDGHTHPAFMLRSTSLNDQGQPLFICYHLRQDGQDSMREVFLPFDDTYHLWLSHYDHVLAYAFGSWTVPVGGEAFDYLITIENPGEPDFHQIETMPFEDSGDLSDGRLRFFRVDDVETGDLISFTSFGMPIDIPDSNAYTSLSLMDPNGDLVIYDNPMHPYYNADHLLVAQIPGSYTIVQDWFILDGPLSKYRLLVHKPEQVECVGSNCASGSLSPGEEIILRWDLNEGDLFGMAAAIGSMTNTLMLVSLYGPDGMPFSGTMYPGFHPEFLSLFYADISSSVYLWLREFTGKGIDEYFIEDIVHATPRILKNQQTTGIEVIEMPGYGGPVIGAAHFLAEEGEIAMLTGFTPHDAEGSWLYPEHRMLLPDFTIVGPTVDVKGILFPDSFINPPFAYIRQSGHYLHIVFDRLGEIGGNTYDISLVTHNVLEMNSPNSGEVLSFSEQRFSRGMRFYLFNGLRSRNINFRVEPDNTSSDMQADIWAFSFGYPAWDWINFIWEANPDSLQLGSIERKTAEAGGELVEMDFFSPYDGPFLLLVQDAANTPYPSYTLGVEIKSPPSNDTCEGAEYIDLSTGHATVTGNSKHASDAVSSAPCTGYRAPGVDVFYEISLNAGDTITISCESDFPRLIYLFTDCDDPAGSCVAGEAIGAPLVLEYTVDAEFGGNYIIGVDSRSRGGNYNLDIQVRSDS